MLKDYLESVRYSVQSEEYSRHLMEIAMASYDVSGYCMSSMPGNPNVNVDAIPIAISTRWEISDQYQEDVAFASLLQAQATEVFWQMKVDKFASPFTLAAAEMRYCWNKSNAEIAELLKCSPTKIDNQISRLFKTSGVDDYTPMDAA